MSVNEIAPKFTGWFWSVGVTMHGCEARCWRDLPKHLQRTNKYREVHIEVGVNVEEALTKILEKIGSV